MESTTETTEITTSPAEIESLPAGINLTAAQRNKEKYQKQIDAANDLIYDQLPELTRLALEKAMSDKDTRLLMDFLNRALGKPVEVQQINTNDQMRQNIDNEKDKLREVPLDELTRQYTEEIRAGT